MAMNVKVAVRMRPLNKREKKLGEEGSVITFDSKQKISIRDPSGKVDDHMFNYDYAFDSSNSEDPAFATQVEVFEDLGMEMIENTMNGFNGCILAYGQTGAGKSYSMMGNPTDETHKGLIPRISEELFRRIEVEKENGFEATVDCSYLEIYNEKVFDLLDTNGGRHRPLAVRDSSTIGPFVEGLTKNAVSEVGMINSLFDQGNALRHVKATAMNATSSRSHAMFQMVVVIKKTEGGKELVKRSRINLVDLAGSERQKKTEATGAALKEGAAINVSLSNLGLVISELVKHGGKPGKKSHIPYRDSTLTWLLRENFGGNSKTAMIAAISPAADNYDETLSTLRYADRAKHIVNKAVINESPADKYVRELQEHVANLEEQLKNAVSSGAVHAEVVAIVEEKESHEVLLREEAKDFAVKLSATQHMVDETKAELEANRIALDKAMHHERDVEAEAEATAKELAESKSTFETQCSDLETKLADAQQKHLTYAAGVEPQMAQLKAEARAAEAEAARYKKMFTDELANEAILKKTLNTSMHQLNQESKKLTAEKSVEEELQAEISRIRNTSKAIDEQFTDKEHQMDQENAALQKAFKEALEKANLAQASEAKTKAKFSSLEDHIVRLKAQLMQAADGTLWNKRESVVHDGPVNLVRPSSIMLAQKSSTIKTTFTELAGEHERAMKQHVQDLEAQLRKAKALESAALARQQAHEATI